MSTPLIERKNPAGTETPSSTQVVRGLSKAIPKDVLTSVNQFQRKQKKGTIDVWWLYDDGGNFDLFDLIKGEKKEKKILFK